MFSWKARHEVLCKINCCKQSFRKEEGFFNSLMIESQTFNEILPQDCELHKCFCHLSLVGQDGQGGLELGIFLLTRG